MNILVVNWTWYPSGGDWTYVEGISKLYEKKGHNVIPFSMKDDRNLSSAYSSYFIDHIDYKKVKHNLTEGVKVLMKSIYSTEAQKNLELLLDKVDIDLVHINVIHHYITPAILKTIKKRNIPVIWTLHEYTPICPESKFYSHGNVCEKCYGGAFYNCITNACKKGSYLASIVAAVENYVHKYLNYYEYVDHYICPSIFHYQKFKQFNFFSHKLVQLYHGYDYEEINATIKTTQKSTERYIIFVGRLEQIKGIQTLLKAMHHCKNILLKVVGTGTEANELMAYKQLNELNNVEFIGKKNRQETLKLIYNAEFLVCPSEWYEVLGFTIVEAMALGIPVIGASCGAIPEMVIDDHTGLLFEPGDHETLAKKIDQLYEQPEMIRKLGINAKEHIKMLIDTEKHYKGLQRLIPGL